MTLRTVIFLIVASTFGSSLSAPPNYFRFEDCDDSCIAQNVSCTIQKQTDHFMCSCSSSDLTCLAEASPSVVCLRPELPPIGGENIWREYREKYHPNLPNVIPDNKFLHYALAGAGSVLAVIFFLIITVLCMLYEKRRNYQPFVNPSPNPGIDNPYMPTTEALET